jgi:hypothetical protein
MISSVVRDEIPLDKISGLGDAWHQSRTFAERLIALVSGNIEAISGPAAQDRPGAHEWMVWQGPAADKAEALKCAEKADPRVDLEWMRIRYERDLPIR